MSENKKKIRLDVQRVLAEYSARQGGKVYQSEFCNRFGISGVTLNNYEAGEVPNVLRFILKVMDATGLAFEEIVIAEPEKQN